MMVPRTLATASLLVALSTASTPLSKPILGYNSYNDVACVPNSTWMEATINAMDANGLRDAGYTYFQIDCGWQAYDRLPNGSITYDTSRFPDGILPVSDLAKSKGFIFSMYTDQGRFSCDTGTPGRAGSLGYESEDAERFAYWGAEYMKVDNCYITGLDANAPKAPRTDFPPRFGAMWEALNDVGIAEMLICQWGVPWINNTGEYSILEGPAEWAPPISTSFRVSDDIADGWPNVERIANENIHVVLRGLSGPGSWSDMDMLEVGNDAFTVDEQKSHFALWAMSKSTLMIGTNVPDMSDQTFGILTNKGLLAANQDDLGKPVALIQRYSNNFDLYGGPLAGGDYAVLMMNSKNATNELSVDFSQLGIWTADVEDLWAGRKVQRKAKSYSASVPAHGNIALRLSNVRNDKHHKAPQLEYFDAASGKLSGTAKVQDCRGCASGEKVGYLTANGSVTITGIRTSEETQNVRFDYINCDIGYLADQRPNYRPAAISVNDGEPQVVNFPLSGYEWTLDVLEGFLVQLSGFNTNGENSLTIAGPEVDVATSDNAYGPDIDRIGIVAQSYDGW